MADPVLTSPQPSNETRSLDPNVLQRAASTPQDSVWVGASAGSGKTKVLTDRILRLLLPQSNGQDGVKAQKILALTFTKAAASEMALRISKRLSEWAVCPMDGDKGLEQNLKALLGYPPTDRQLDQARKLFADVVETPGGLKIMTIHSFCQSVLGRFPLEADLPPNFKALEESQAKLLLKKSIAQTLSLAESQKGSSLSGAVDNLIFINNEDQISNLFQQFMSEKRQVQNILKKYFDPDGLCNALCQFFNIAPQITKEDYLTQSCNISSSSETKLRHCCTIMASGTPKTDQKNSIIIQEFLDAPLNKRKEIFDDYKGVLLTKENTIKNQRYLVTKSIIDKNPQILDTLHEEAIRLINIQENIQKAYIASVTRDLFIMGQSILEAYESLKSNENVLDFDDLILRTLDLLQGNTQSLHTLNATPWIRYKMDQGIDHILVDKSQDTNPEQWEIIKMLCDDFYDSIEDNDKTVFIVGDEKQSIFSFQRASPEKFHDMQDWFLNKIKNIEDDLQIINFETSFRSTPAILDFVDEVFKNEETRQGLSALPIKHYSHRKTQAGHVELWPVFESEDDEDDDPWALPLEVSDSTSGAVKMANHIGDTIKTWMNENKILPSHNRPIKAGDIMILVKSRNAFLDQLVRALKTRDIPVSGVDRMVLKDQLVVQDLIAFMKFALLPDDDLNLATILKSPLIGWNEDQLYKYCYKRQGSLWANIKENYKDETLKKWLNTLIRHAGKSSPYDFISLLLQKPCPAHETSGIIAIKERLGEECLDPLNEFMNKALEYEVDNVPNLQNFVQDHLIDDSQIKRQMDEGSEAVRIMTVHGAKGLQSPIVILPDTVRSTRGNNPDRILWPDKTNHALPYYCPTSDDLPEACQDAKQLLQDREDQEYRRLLYVALTRAEDQLYIGGYQGKKKMIEESWYKYIESAFKTVKDAQVKVDNDVEIKIFSNPATDKADKEQELQFKTTKNFDTPDWLHQPIPEEDTPPRPLSPSRPSDEEVATLSPLANAQNNRFKRGNITHKMLQILPDVPTDLRQAKATQYVSQKSFDLSKDVQADIVKEVMNILNHEKFAPIFGEGSIAEAPITGLINGNKLVSGQIDRLLITDNDIFIIDYKSNRPSPDDAKDIPKIYYNQMKTYADVMQEIYPKHKIKAALLWTDSCHLMEIDVS